ATVPPSATTSSTASRRSNFRVSAFSFAGIAGKTTVGSISRATRFSPDVHVEKRGNAVIPPSQRPPLRPRPPGPVRLPPRPADQPGLLELLERGPDAGGRHVAVQDGAPDLLLRQRTLRLQRRQERDRQVAAAGRHPPVGPPRVRLVVADQRGRPGDRRL